MKPKAALVKDGFLPAGSENTRGRMSGAAIKRCEELAAQGWKIDGFEAKASTDTSKPVTVSRVVTDPNRVVDCPDPLRDERYFVSTIMVEGKPVIVGNRTVCNGCHSSLGYCPCPNPRVWVDHKREAVVSFSYKKGD